MGFKINFYAPCVANKVINDSQMTICWHVDDLEISHKDPEEVNQIITKLEKLYGKTRVSRGLYHDYLGINLDFRTILP